MKYQLRDKFCFLHPHFPVSRIQDTVKLGCFVGLSSFSTCIWPERNKKWEGIKEDVKIAVVVLKAFWDNFYMD